jgi:hypothetical protein
MHRNRKIRQPLARYWLSHVDSQFAYRDTKVPVELYLNMLIRFYKFFFSKLFWLKQIWVITEDYNTCLGNSYRKHKKKRCMHYSVQYYCSISKMIQSFCMHQQKKISYIFSFLSRALQYHTKALYLSHTPEFFFIFLSIPLSSLNLAI